MEENNNINNNGKFSYGFLLSIPAWILSSFLISIVPILLNINKMTMDGFLQGISFRTIFTAVYSLIIWIPLAIIAGKISKKRGKKAARLFVVASIFISFLVVGGCQGIMLQS